jgi:hypothetical protein
MDLPSSVVVLGKVYSIIKSDHIEECGLTEPHECKIWISTNISPQQMKDTLLHELVHAIDYEMHLGMKERQVHCVATGILDMLNRNPQLVNCLGLTSL